MVYRRLDELGRVVIPKEMRKIMGLENGDIMSIDSDEDRIIVKKCTSTTSFNCEATKYLRLLASEIQYDIALVSGGKVKNIYFKDGTFHRLEDCIISDRLAEIIDSNMNSILEELFCPTKLHAKFMSSEVYPVADANGKPTMAIINMIDAANSNSDGHFVSVSQTRMLQFAAEYLSKLNHVED